MTQTGNIDNVQSSTRKQQIERIKTLQDKDMY